MVKNSSSNAGYVGSTPDQGVKIPHASGELNLHATTTELCALEPMSCNESQSVARKTQCSQRERERERERSWIRVMGGSFWCTRKSLRLVPQQPLLLVPEACSFLEGVG